MLIAAASLLSACASSPPPAAQKPERRAPQAEGATIEGIRSNADTRAQEIVGDQFQLRGLASFQEIMLPLERPTDEAWKVVDESAFPALTRGVWNQNGLRIGLLSRDKVAEFVKRLPPATGMGQSELMGSEHPTPILRTPRLRGYATIDLTIPPMPVREEEVTGGRLQLLARLTRDHRGALVVDLLPHHHVPKLDFKVRDALEKELDGRIFEELTLRAEVPGNALLVIGLYRPWPVPPAEEAPAPQPIVTPEMLPQPTEGGQVATAQPAPEEKEEVPATAALPGPPLPNHLGRALLAGMKLGKPQQTVLIIAVEPLGGAGPRFAPSTNPSPTP